MKSRGEHRGRWGEGRLVAVALILVLALSFAVHITRIPPEETVVPVYAVPVEELRHEEMVNLNAASVEELSALPGVGEVLAKRIAAYREAYGAFSSVEELLQVEGIGEGKLEDMRNEIYID